ncbi:MAG: hypothetical protein ACHP9Z_07190 [Streptosporangiales bacterium]
MLLTVGVPPTVGPGVAVGAVLPGGEDVAVGVAARPGEDDLPALGVGRAEGRFGVAVARGVAGADVAGCVLAGAGGATRCACATGLGRTSR